MLAFKVSAITQAKPAVVWNRFIDLSTWPEWSASIVSITLNGTFRPTTTGTIVLHDGATYPIVITQVAPDQYFEIEARSMGSVVHLKYSIDIHKGVCSISCQVNTSGSTAWIVGLWNRIMFAPILQQSIDELAHVADQDQFKVEQEIVPRTR